MANGTAIAVGVGCCVMILLVVGAVIFIAIKFAGGGGSGDGTKVRSCGANCKFACEPGRVWGTDKAASMCCKENTDLSNPANCSAPFRVDKVMMYKEANFKGESWTYPTGKWDTMPGGISSMRVPPGFKVEAYNSTSKTESKVFTDDASSLGGFNDSIAAIIVSKK